MVTVYNCIFNGKKKKFHANGSVDPTKIKWVCFEGNVWNVEITKSQERGVDFEIEVNYSSLDCINDSNCTCNCSLIK